MVFPATGDGGAITRNVTLPGEDGNDRLRARIENKHASILASVFAGMLRTVIPRDSRAETLEPDAAMARYRAAAGPMRDALVDMLREAALAGARMGRRQVEALTGAAQPRGNAQARVFRVNRVVIRATDWEMVNQEVLDWVVGSFEGLGSGYGDTLAASLVQTSEGQIRHLIAEWIRAGSPLMDLERALEEFVFARERAHLIASTEVTRAYAEGNMAAWRAAGIIQRRRWETSADELVCPVCGPLQGQVRELDEEFDGGIMQPPAHPRCILPGNEVVTPGFVEAAAKSFYDGPAVEIVVESGRRLTVTENHPILTRRGWVAAKLLRPGDHVLRCVDSQRVASTVNPDDEHVPTVIEQVFDTLRMTGAMTTRRVPVAAEDLHGDGRHVYGDIEVVGTHRLLIGDGHSSGVQPFAHAQFVGPGRNGDFAARGLVALFVEGGGAPAHCPVCRRDLASTLRCGHLRPLDGLGLGSTATGDAVTLQIGAQGEATDAQRLGEGFLGLTGQVAGDDFFHVGDELGSMTAAVNMDAGGDQGTGDGLLADAALTREFTDRFAGLITPDEVVEVREFNFAGHVYDLQVGPYPVYFTEDIITHNCRCWLVPVVEDVPAEERMPTPEPATVRVQPLGTPVSGALNVPKRGKYSKTYQQTLAAIDAVHGDGPLPEILVKTNTLQGAFGYFAMNSRTGEAIEIGVSGSGDHKEVTLAHEVGHFLDSHGIGQGGSPASLGDPRLDEWRQAVIGSQAVAVLVDKYTNPVGYAVEVPSPYAGVTVQARPLPARIRYLLGAEEVWARSYAQYIALRSGNVEMLAQLDGLRRDILYGEAQWSDDDFEPIAEAMDRLFRGLGWQQ